MFISFKQADMSDNPIGWTLTEFVTEELGIGRDVGSNLVRLFEDENSVPFIARYRKKETKGMEVEQIRKAHKLYEEAKAVKSKIKSVTAQIEKMGKLDVKLATTLNSTRTMDEIESLYAPFKTSSKGSLASRAKELGLEEAALKIINGDIVAFHTLVNPEKEGLRTEEEVKIGLRHIISEYILKQTSTQDAIRDVVQQKRGIRIQSTASKLSKKKKKDEEGSKADEGKFLNYEDFDLPAASVRPHQVLAMNRGEKEKALTVKIDVPEHLKEEFCGFTRKRILNLVRNVHREDSEAAMLDCYTRLVLPHIRRAVRSQLTKNAEEASVELFASNTRQLLMKQPVKGVHILGLDPGFKHGCKAAVISPSNEILDTFVIYLGRTVEAERTLVEKMQKYASFKVAIGNGKGCRETEQLVSGLITKGRFKPSIVEYCVVNECGASIYSVSPLALEELPDMDPNLRSAVSIARRLQNPLAELVKIEPEHLGVGQYQLDVNAKLLNESLEDIVKECVSFVGVDVNTCSLQLLQRVAGLNKARAQKILDKRRELGTFCNRKEIANIKGIGPKSFQQAAGFIRIFTTSSLQSGATTSAATVTKKRKLEASEEPKKKRKKAEISIAAEPLDSTSIHPEFYPLATKIIDGLGCDKVDIGSDKLINVVKNLDAKKLSNLVAKSGEDELTVKQVLDSLKEPPSLDYREGFETPLFRAAASSIDDLKTGSVLSGAVTNVTDFGAFVDVGVGRDGLIHSSQLRGKKLQIGARVSVKVLSVDLGRKRISLGLNS